MRKPAHRDVTHDYDDEMSAADLPDQEWVKEQQEAMQKIAAILDTLEKAVNQCGPVDLLEAYLIALPALREVDMDKSALEQFVAVLVADRTHHGV